MRAVKALGQNFLVNEHTASRIADRVASREPLEILEVGPGKGALTYKLAERCRHITAVELDAFLAENLRTDLSAKGVSNVDIIHKDILTFSFENAMTGTFQVVGALPFNISKRIIRRFITSPTLCISFLHAIVQKEVADKMTASPPKGSYLGHYVKLYANAGKIFDIPAGQFSPRPSVDASYIEFEIKRPDKDHLERDRFFKKLFQNPRKTVQNNLKQKFSSAEAKELAHNHKHLLSYRPEDLTATDVEAIYIMYNMSRKHDHKDQ